jgi:hypothetical protein
MIRRVAFKKAAFAGASGALVWELVVRALIFAGVPLFDLVKTLGILVLGPGARPVFWWPVGLAMHLIVGVIWAIFYAYFFWSTLDLPPFFQGVLFSLLPALLAGVIMIPQMDVMIDGQMPELGIFASRMGWLGPLGVICGHLIYGVVMGALYTNPVGYAVRNRKRMVVYG